MQIPVALQKAADNAPMIVSASGAIMSVLTYAQVVVSIIAGLVAIAAGLYSIFRPRK